MRVQRSRPDFLNPTWLNRWVEDWRAASLHENKQPAWKPAKVQLEEHKLQSSIRKALSLLVVCHSKLAAAIRFIVDSHEQSMRGPENQSAKQVGAGGNFKLIGSYGIE